MNIDWTSISVGVAVVVLGIVFLPKLIDVFKTTMQGLISLLADNLDKVNETLTTLKDLNERQEQNTAIILEDMQSRLHRIEQLLLLHLNVEQNVTKPPKNPVGGEGD